MTKCKIVKSVQDLKVGDRVTFDDGKEVINLKITRIDLKKKEIDVKHRKIETWLLYSDIQKGHVKKCSK